MKRLVRLLLVNWYRLEAESIEIDGHTAFIGPNASGKSSLLDAIQTVLVGGDKRQLSLNASAGEKSTRSIRDYCLGVVRDPDNPDLSLEFRPREQAITYLVLCFRDEESNEETAVGLALHASLDQPQEQVDGRFIAPGLNLILSDLVEHTPRGMVPKPWKQLRADLYHRCSGTKVIPQSGEFVRMLCAVLSDGRRHLDPQRFLRSFRNAITFAPIRNVSDFVRQFVLEDRPIQVRQLQQALKHYRDIRAKTEEAKAREAALEQINQRYTRAEQAEHRALAYRWAEREAAFNAADAEIEPLRDALDLLNTRQEADARSLEQMKETHEEATQAWMNAKARLDASGTAQAKARIEAERKLFDAEKSTLQQGLDSARRGLAKVHRLLDEETQLPPALRQPLSALAGLMAARDGLLATLWPEEPQAITEVVEAMKPALHEARDALKELLNDRTAEWKRLQKELEEMRERMKRLEQGESDLSPGTRRLLMLLAARGIKAVPLCDRVDVSDERWRDAVERFLGGQREALLVAPDQVREAIRVYRQEGKRDGIHGSRIINTVKTGEWKERAEPGSLAEVVITDDPHARAYVNRLMGNVRRVETEDELTRHERAITPDGMLATNGAVLRTQPLEPMLGREARARGLAALQQRFQEQAAAFGGMQAEKEAAERFKDELFDPFLRHIESLPDLNALVQERAACEAKLATLDEEERGLKTGDYERLQAEVEQLAQARERLGKTLEALQQQIHQSGIELDRKERELAAKEAELRQIADARRAVEQRHGLDREDAARRLEELEEQTLGEGDEAGRWRALSQQAAARAEDSERKCQRARHEARESLREYLNRWPADEALSFFLDDDHRPLAAWTVRSLTAIRETQLALYDEQAAHALREAELAFRADFMSRLKENLSRLDEQLHELRRNLKSRPFHGQYYSFIKKPDPDFEPIIRWVETWTPEQAGDVGGLFDSANDPNHPHQEAIRRIQSLLMEASENAALDERLADYRYYYGFDVKMTDADGGNPELLSRRLGKGSGGEHQSPFYVAIGAALAAAYRLQRDDDGMLRGGMALAVFDEAFSKLDVQNTVSALGFLDELGLQVLLAAPDEKYGLMSEHVDTIVNVYRSGGTVFVDADYLKPAARKLLARDNPIKQPAELIDE